jgi:hypothetical protein
VHLEVSTKPHVHNLIHEFLINMAFTMACPNFKKGLKMATNLWISYTGVWIKEGREIELKKLHLNLQYLVQDAAYEKNMVLAFEKAQKCHI